MAQRSSRATLLSVAALLLLWVACSSDKGGGPPADEPEKGNVWVDTVDAAAGEQARVDVHAIVKSPLQGVGLPLKLTGTGFALDSVSFVGTILERRPLLGTVRIESPSPSMTTVNIIRTYSRSTYIEPTEGILVSLFVALSDSPETRTIAIDTVTLTPSNFWFVDTTDTGVVPEFTPGYINVSPAL
jgi:hypothetical protein